MADLMLALSGFAAAVNIGMIVYYMVLARRAHRLSLLLGQICVRAFIGQHLPYWKPWADTFGFNLTIRVVPARVTGESRDEVAH